jgi:hypothetical protein
MQKHRHQEIIGSPAEGCAPTPDAVALKIAISYCRMDPQNVKRTHALAAKLQKDGGFEVVIDLNNDGSMSWPQFLDLMFECPKVLLGLPDSCFVPNHQMPSAFLTILMSTRALILSALKRNRFNEDVQAPQQSKTVDI